MERKLLQYVQVGEEIMLSDGNTYRAIAHPVKVPTFGVFGCADCALQNHHPPHYTSRLCNEVKCTGGDTDEIRKIFHKVGE